MSHAAQIDESITRSLNRAGIRPRYHRGQLSEHPSKYSAELVDWVLGASKEEPGTGWTMIGGNDTEDLAILLARGLHITGRAMRVLSAMTFQRYLAEDRVYLRDTTQDASGLLLTQLGPQDVKEERIFTDREIRGMENWLNDWVAEGNRLLVHSSRPLEGAWFSANFLQRVATVNETIREDI